MTSKRKAYKNDPEEVAHRSALISRRPKRRRRYPRWLLPTALGLAWATINLGLGFGEGLLMRELGIPRGVRSAIGLVIGGLQGLATGMPMYNWYQKRERRNKNEAQNRRL